MGFGLHDDRDERPYGGRGGGRGGGGGSSGCRVFVHNLAFATSWQDLKDHGRQAGEVVHAKIMQDASGRSKGVGTIEFATRQDAAEAVRVLDGSELDGRAISVREDREMEDRSGGGGGGFESRGAPRAAAGGGDDSCYNCGGMGHRARDCPSEPGLGAGGGAGGRAPRVRMSDRVSERPARGAGGGGAAGGACHNCGEVGHFARECPSGGGGGGGGRGGGRGRGGGGGRGAGRPTPMDASALDNDLDSYFNSRPAKE